MLKRLYEAYGYDTSMELVYAPPEEMGYESSGIFKIFNFLLYLIGDHAIVAVQYAGEWYYYDPTNLLYLAKKDAKSFTILNDSGEFTNRYLTSFAMNLGEGIKNIFRENNLNYDQKVTYIDAQILEDFYQKEVDRINNIYELVNSYPQHLIFFLSLFGAQFLVSKLEKLLEKYLSRRYQNNEGYLKEMVDANLPKKEGDALLETLSYLRYLIVNDYLTDNDVEKLKTSVLFETPAMVTVSSEFYGKNFFNYYVRKKYPDVSAVIGVDDDVNSMVFYVCRQAGKYYFYSFDDDAIYTLNASDELVNGKKKYKLILSSKDKNYEKYRNEEGFVGSIKVDEDLASLFSLKNQERIKEIAKVYSYMPRNK